MYVAADEQDLIGLRTSVRKPHEEVYLFRTRTKLENARRLFRSYLEEINSLRQRPEFYNTATTNCTTSVLLRTAAFPTKLPFTWQVLVSGYFPDYLHGLGGLDQDRSVEELRRLGHINQRAQEAFGTTDFSRQIRKGVPHPSPRE